ncbi:MAG: hypothetical protein SNJ59_10790 [Aggregatilineales bacterium]
MSQSSRRIVVVKRILLIGLGVAAVAAAAIFLPPRIACALFLRDVPAQALIVSVYDPPSGERTISVMDYDAQTICPIADGNRILSVFASPDGRQVGYSHVEGLLAVSHYNGENFRVVADGLMSSSRPAWGTQAVAFAGFGGDDASFGYGVFVWDPEFGVQTLIEVDRHPPRELSTDKSVRNISWLGDETLAYYVDSASKSEIFVAPLRRTDSGWQLAEEPRMIEDHVVWSRYETSLSAAHNRLVWINGRDQPTLRMLLLEGETDALEIAAVPSNFAPHAVEWSPSDPDTLAVAGQYFPQGFAEDVIHNTVYLYSAETGEFERIYFGEQSNQIRIDFMSVAWSSDGRHLFFSDNRRLWRYDVDTQRVTPFEPSDVSTIFYSYTRSLGEFSVLR